MSQNSNNKYMNIKDINDDWKNKNKRYLRELELFLDKAENIKDERLKKEIVFQMLKCDEVLTLIAKEKFVEYYNLGYKSNT